MSGFINCTKGSGEDATAAKNFLPDLSSRQIAAVSNNTVVASVLVASVGGPDQNYGPFYNMSGFNPWRYVSPGTNNPASYDCGLSFALPARRT